MFFLTLPPLLKTSVSFNQVTSFQLKFLSDNTDVLFFINGLVFNQNISGGNYQAVDEYFTGYGNSSLLILMTKESEYFFMDVFLSALPECAWYH